MNFTCTVCVSTCYKLAPSVFQATWDNNLLKYFKFILFCFYFFTCEVIIISVLFN